MNLEKIKEIVNYNTTDHVKKSLIISVLSEDKEVIQYILEILSIEREKKEALILDSNMELSRALVVLNDKNLKWDKDIITDPKWVVGEIKKHYTKWKDYIKCNFRIEGV